MFAPGVPELMLEFGSKSSELASFCVSVYVLGFAAGPMIFAPMSELYGRVIVYHIGNVGFIGKFAHLSKELFITLYSLCYCLRKSSESRRSHRVSILERRVWIVSHG